MILPAIVGTVLVEQIGDGGWVFTPYTTALAAPPADGREGRLTARQVEILQGIADHGDSNIEVGARLGITEGTVKIHMRRIFQRLHASDRAHAVHEAMRQGYVT